VFLAEAALGDMHLAYEPDQFTNGLPPFNHSVYGVGQEAPAMNGLRDMKKENFEIDSAQVQSADTLYFNTGKMR
jgi:hypothetical protein